MNDQHSASYRYQSPPQPGNNQQPDEPYREPMPENTQVPMPEDGVQVNQRAEDDEQYTSSPPNSQEETTAAASAETQPEETPVEGVLPSHLKPEQEQLIFEWQTLARPFNQDRKKQPLIVVMTILALISLILFFSGQWPLIAVLVAGAFLMYVIMTTPPASIVVQITTYGLRLNNELYMWEEMGRFWFTTEQGHRCLNVEVEVIPFKLTIVVGSADEETLRQIMQIVLIEETPPPTTYEKAGNWFQRNIPLDFDS